MTWGKSLLLTIPLALSGIFVIASPAAADTQIGTQTDWTSVSSGGSHTCAIRSGRLYCWGNNDNGQVGNNGDNRQDVPDRIGSETDWTSVSAGGLHTCGIRGGGKLYCWGSDSDGQLGNGSSGGRDTPGPVSSGATWKSVTAGASHTCAIRSDFILACWGNNENGQVGKAGAQWQTPVLVSAARWNVVSAGGAHTCGIHSGGTLACWGSDAHGQIGNGAAGGPSVPTEVRTTVRDWKTVSAGGEHTCAIRGAGLLACWGSDERGQVGNGAGGSTTVPAQITSATDWKVVSAGGSNTCAIRGTGALYCWGDNTYGETTGSSSNTPRTSPVRLYSSVADFKTADAGYQLSCGIRTNGKLYCWGGMTPTPSCSVATLATRPTQIDLAYWKLTTPVDLDNNGIADEIKQPQLSIDTPTFSADYFQIPADSGSRIFKAAVDGATTSGSSYPRSELREMGQYPDSYTNAAWARSSGTHIMRIYQTITHLPAGRPNVVAGQIHDGNDDMLQIRLEGSKLLVTFNNGNDSQVLDSNYVLGTPMDLQIQADSCGMTVTYKNATQTTTKPTVPVTSDNGKWYFKAGVYTQANTSNGTGYGEVRIDGLSIQHS